MYISVLFHFACLCFIRVYQYSVRIKPTYSYFLYVADCDYYCDMLTCSLAFYFF